jgi:hypothetical protein
MDDGMQALNAGDFELERRFEAYARARLSPDPQATARIRARVMREARLQHDAARIAAHMAPAMADHRRTPFRRLAVPLLAAAVWLGIAVGSIAASQAGGPLYPARIWVETATLPAAGAGRIDADLQHLDARLGEVLSAATRGDRGGVAAALEAWAQSAEDATQSSGTDEALEDRVAAALSNHQAVLTAVVQNLLDKGNDTAAAAIQANIVRAIDHNAAVIANLKTHHPGTGTGPGNGAGNGNGNANGAGNGNGGAPGTGNGNANGAGNGNANGGNGNANGAGNGAGAGNGNGNGNGATGGKQPASSTEGAAPTPHADASSAPATPTATSGGGNGGNGGNGNGNGNNGHPSHSPKTKSH